MAEDLTSLVLPDFGRNPVEFLREVKVELKKVVWPSKEEVMRMTILIVVVSIITGAFVGGLDYTFTKLFQLAVR